MMNETKGKIIIEEANVTPTGRHGLEFKGAEQRQHVRSLSK